MLFEDILHWQFLGFSFIWVLSCINHHQPLQQHFLLSFLTCNLFSIISWLTFLAPVSPLTYSKPTLSSQFLAQGSPLTDSFYSKLTSPLSSPSLFDSYLFNFFVLCLRKKGRFCQSLSSWLSFIYLNLSFSFASLPRLIFSHLSRL